MSLRSCVVLVGLFLVAVAMARPKFIAIPLLDDLSVLELDEQPHVRVPRETAKQGLDEGASGSNYRFERQAGGDGHEHVDYGAHTGHHGAFGWYADFPVHAHH